ncbi:hypothetical protein CUMW_275920 [Citrus unshiu]|uniref:Uncharacterized protein n=1 Tax=Citrus unshiu TaxID=55188 RepID=A0A2H5N094_CITUN|nr:hypothetical protein CUMW_275920 [Citrus unshiu]
MGMHVVVVVVIQQKNPKLPLSKLKENNQLKDSVLYAVMEANIILPYPSFCAPLLQHAELEIKEAAWPVLNATYGGSHEHIQFLVSQGCIKPLCDLLGLEDIFKVGEVNKEIGMDNWEEEEERLIQDGGIGNQQQGLGFATNQPNIPTFHLVASNLVEVVV